MEFLTLLAAGVFSLLVGSFLNVVIYRLPISMMASWRRECRAFLTENDGLELGEAPAEERFNVAFPRSHCPSCKQLIPAWCNIPVLSWVLLKGRCLRCKSPISLRYPFVELLTAATGVFCVWSYGLSFEAAALMLFSWTLICLIYIDIDHQLLPDSLTLPLLWAGLAVNSVATFVDLQSAVYGAMAGYLSLWSIYWAFKLLTGKEGMGFGDFKLLAALGAWMGWQQLPTIIILSSAVGAIFGIAGILMKGKDKDTPMPFGPYLAIAGWFAFFWGSDIQRWYLGLIAA
ncbi:prepilin peptidase [Agaribacterium haliotis]|uniref:prepilin peptidase n=1 Tax=Agaribacterium haliotis TaxID=2013869 RepID=UPI000BB57213|nr:A24 family peptidase [Agaribacterium haliotis]